MKDIIIKTFLGLCLGILIGSTIKDCRSSYKYNKVLGNKQEIVDTLSLQDSIKQFIKSMNMSHADIVYAQAVLESGNFKSKLFTENNNLFGMKEPLVRNTVALGTRNGYAYYKNWQHSIIDYALYQATYYGVRKNRWEDLERQAYLDKLSRTYASDPDYINKLHKIMNNEFIL